MIDDFIEHLEERINKKIEQVQQCVSDHSVGVANVYMEVAKVSQQLALMKSLQDRMEHETLPIDEVELTLRIKSYPMNIRIHMAIETNFGDISYAWDFPPSAEARLAESLHTCYFNLLNELYQEHEKRGGRFIGEDRCKEWMDKNGRTVIKKEDSFSPRFPK